MAKRIMIRKGDVFCVEVDAEFKCYFQYIANDMTFLNAAVIRVFKCHYQLEYLPNINEIVNDSINFYVHTIIEVGVKAGAWYKVGNHKDVGDLSSICFRWLDDIGPSIVKSKKWYIWKLNGPIVEIGEMRDDFLEYDIGIVVPYRFIIEKIKGGKLLPREIL